MKKKPNKQKQIKAAKGKKDNLASVSELREVVYLFDGDEEIHVEVSYSHFQSWVRGEMVLKDRAASAVKAAYCVVGNQLSLKAVVFFQFLVGEQGRVDANFNLPLTYLAQQGGMGVNLGHGDIRKASRGQCPVPWHAVNLWEPKSLDVLQALQTHLHTNQLGLAENFYEDQDPFFAELEDDSGNTIELTPIADINFGNAQEIAANISASISKQGQQQSASQQINPQEVPDLDVASQQMGEKLSDAFGVTGKVGLSELVRLHASQIDQLKNEFRREIEVQQVGFLQHYQIAQQQIEHLKTALRQEQNRNQRLQEMLRGDL